MRGQGGLDGPVDLEADEKEVDECGKVEFKVWVHVSVPYFNPYEGVFLLLKFMGTARGEGGQAWHVDLKGQYFEKGDTFAIHPWTVWERILALRGRSASS